MSKPEEKLNSYKVILIKPMTLRRDNNKISINSRMMSDSKRRRTMMLRWNSKFLRRNNAI